MGGTCNTHEGHKKYILNQITSREDTLRRLRRTWEDNIKTDLRHGVEAWNELNYVRIQSLVCVLVCVRARARVCIVCLQLISFVRAFLSC
jgi:hypothetical protein